MIHVHRSDSLATKIESSPKAFSSASTHARKKLTDWEQGGKVKELQQYKFCYAGSGMNFAVFSDGPCRISYVKSVPIPIGHTMVELYEIDPGAKTQWIVVKQVDGYKNTLKVFLRQNGRFLENSMDQLSRETKKQIMQRFPTLAAETKALLAGKALGKRFGRMVKKIGEKIKKSVHRDREKKEAMALDPVGTRKTAQRFSSQRPSPI
jgi:hypothetical protein